MSYCSGNVHFNGYASYVREQTKRAKYVVAKLLFSRSSQILVGSRILEVQSIYIHMQGGYKLVRKKNGLLRIVKPEITKPEKSHDYKIMKYSYTKFYLFHKCSMGLSFITMQMSHR